MTGTTPVLAIFGPTASGKSAAALAAARAFGGVVINADAMQLYADLPILSAAPSRADMEAAPHRLYGVLDAAEAGSAERWREMALREIRNAAEAGCLPILVGGTGLYLKAILNGLSPIPPVPDAIRSTVRARMATLGPAVLHAELSARDPRTAAGLRPSDPQRVARALEVLEATGRPLAEWQDMPPDGPPPNLAFRVAVIAPPRDVVYAACDTRLAAMLAAGALQEVERLRRRGLDPALPAMKTLGVPHFIAHLMGELSREEALRRAQAATRAYAKRQFVWVNHHIISSYKENAQFSEKSEAGFFAFIRENVLTQRTQDA